MLDLEDKTALVTGGSQGIGSATVRVFRLHGIRTFFTYRGHEKEALALADRTGALAIKADLSSLQGPVALAGEFLDRAGGKADILVHNAGIWTYGEMGRLRSETWRATMTVNLDAVYALTDGIVGAMKKQAHGSIVFVSSTAARRGEAFHSHYAASKGALIALARSLAVELGPCGIRTNVVAPGWVETPMTEEVLRDPATHGAITATIPLGRIAGPDDVAYPILFLSSRWARHINGAVLDVNGGSVLVD